jgi:putative heme-binding domain-containing protein
MEKTADNETTILLKKALLDKNIYQRLHAMYLLAGKNLLSTEELAGVFKDESPPILEAALLISEKFIGTDEDILKKCMALLTHRDMRVRMQAALTLSTIQSSDNLYQSYKNELLKGLVSGAGQQQDDWTIAAITLAAGDSAARLFSMLCQTSKPNAELLASLALNSNQSTEDMKIILNTIAATKILPQDKKKIIQQLLKNPGSINGRELDPAITMLERQQGISLLPDMMALRNKLNLPPSNEFLKFSKEALEKAPDNSLPDSVRLQQLSLIELIPYKQKSDVLFECLKNNQPLSIQEAALRQMANYPEREIGQRVVGMWRDLSPQTRRYASDLLLYIEVHHDALLTGLENGTINIGEMNFDLERRRTLLWWTENVRTKQRAQKLFRDEGVNNRQDAINKMKPALSLNGVALNGAKVFESVCSNCHLHGNTGKEVGPVLTEIYRKSKETILHDILDPNAAVEPKYINHRLETLDGIVHLGIVFAETDQSITIMKTGGEKVTVSKTEVKSFRSLGSSLMMAGLESSMTVQEMADLLEFLQKRN